MRPRTFRLGKTVIQHQLAKWADAEISSTGYGERGNEMTDVLLEFPNSRTPFGPATHEEDTAYANTSNMPVAAMKPRYTRDHDSGIFP